MGLDPAPDPVGLRLDFPLFLAEVIEVGLGHVVGVATTPPPVATGKELVVLDAEEELEAATEGFQLAVHGLSQAMHFFPAVVDEDEAKDASLILTIQDQSGILEIIPAQALWPLHTGEGREGCKQILVLDLQVLDFIGGPSEVALVLALEPLTVCTENQLLDLLPAPVPPYSLGMSKLATLPTGAGYGVFPRPITSIDLVALVLEAVGDTRKMPRHRYLAEDDEWLWLRRRSNYFLPATEQLTPLSFEEQLIETLLSFSNR